jgi:hypothetical protein
MRAMHGIPNWRVQWELKDLQYAPGRGKKPFGPVGVCISLYCEASSFRPRRNKKTAPAESTTTPRSLEGHLGIFTNPKTRVSTSISGSRHFLVADC